MAVQLKSKLPIWDLDVLLNPDTEEFPEQKPIDPKQVFTDTGLNKQYLYHIFEEFLVSIDRQTADPTKCDVGQLYKDFCNTWLLLNRVDNYVTLTFGENRNSKVFERARTKIDEFSAGIEKRLKKASVILSNADKLAKPFTDEENAYDSEIEQLGDEVVKQRNHLYIETEHGDLSLANAMQLLPSLPRNERRKLNEQIQDLLERHKESGFNRIIRTRKAKVKLDRNRGYELPFEHEDEESGFDNADEERWMHASGFGTKEGESYRLLTNEYIEQISELMPDRRILYADLKSPIALAESPMTFEEAGEIIIRAFGKSLNQENMEFVKQYFTPGPGFLDAATYKNRFSDYSYCQPSRTTPSFISNRFLECATSDVDMAHELGHALNYRSSRLQNNMNELPLIADELVAAITEYMCYFELMQDKKDIYRELAAHSAFLTWFSRSVPEYAGYTAFENYLHTGEENPVEGKKRKALPSTEELEHKWSDIQKRTFGKNFDEKMSQFDFYSDSYLTTPYYTQSYSKCAILALALMPQYLSDPKKFGVKFEKLIEAINKPGKVKPLKKLLEEIFEVDFKIVWSAGMPLVREKLDSFKKLVTDEKELADFLGAKVAGLKPDNKHYSIEITTSEEASKLNRLGFKEAGIGVVELPEKRVRQILDPHLLVRQYRISRSPIGVVQGPGEERIGL